jgi:hypothetical protein
MSVSSVSINWKKFSTCANIQAPKKSKDAKAKEAIEYDDSKTGPDGKKDVSGDLPSEYSPRYVEKQWYTWWKQKGFFKPEFMVSTTYSRTDAIHCCFPYLVREDTSHDF